MSNTGAYGYIANYSTLFTTPERMSTESAIVVGSAAANHSQELNVGFQSEADLLGGMLDRPEMAVMRRSQLWQVGR